MKSAALLQELVQAHAAEIRPISDSIYRTPELGYHEYQASKAIADYLEQRGFQVQRGVVGLETAIKAWFIEAPEESTPAVCIPAEYDALAGLGHGCGHNLITACSLAAAVSLADYAKKWHVPLRLCFMGTPAEESLAGKVVMIERGAFDGLDMAVMAHPGQRNITESGALGIARCRIVFKGRASHAGSAPEFGINALDAMVLFYSDMLKWKAELAPRERVHGIITRGGDAPNIVPDYTESEFYVRAPAIDALERLKAKLLASVRLGAKQTGCTCEVTWGRPYMPILVNMPISVRYKEIWHELGEDIPLLTGTENKASTDMGNVTRIMPGAQFHFQADEAGTAPLHTEAFKAAAGTDFAFNMALKAGGAIAQLLLDYSTDAAFRQNVNEAFLAQT